MQLYDFAPTLNDLYTEVITGLRQAEKRLPGALLYDEQGSQLFDKICEQPEYYLTRTELGILRKYISDIVALLGEGVALVEYGSGSSLKTTILLDHLPNLTCYIPIDISKEHLLKAAAKLAKQYPHLEILPVCADYSQPFHLPTPRQAAARYVAYYPGSTISHFCPEQAIAFLAHIRRVCGSAGGLLIGVDLKKAASIIEPAYNDSAGVSPVFVYNALVHLNWRFDANFDLGRFAHRAFYNEALGRVEVYLVSRLPQTVCINGTPVTFQADEPINLAYSYKYSLAEFADLAAKAGWCVKQVWTDDEQLFSVQYLTVMGG